MIFRVVAASGLALLLSGCVTDQEKCNRYGYASGTSEFLQCMNMVGSQRQAASQSLMAVGTQLMIAGQAPPPPAIQPPIVCTPAYGGRMICQ